MIENYDVTGNFYEDEIFKYRRFLNIKRKGIDVNKNDLTVIMMNPGKSKPIIDDGKFEGEKADKFVAACVDSTLKQIIRVMDICDLNFAKVLNLSNIRNTNSSEFCGMVKKNDINDVHLIFSDENRKKLREYDLNPDSVFLFACGNDRRLDLLRIRAQSRLNEMFPERKELQTSHPNCWGSNKNTIWVNKTAIEIMKHFPKNAVSEKIKKCNDEIIAAKEKMKKNG